MKTIIPMSIGQQGIWYLAKVSSESCASYNVVLAFNASKSIDEKLLRQALDTILEEHPCLGAYVTVRDFIPSFDCTKRLKIPVKRVKGSLQDYAYIEAGAPIDLDTGPLCRVVIVESDVGTGLLITVHHIVFDSVSVGILIDKLSSYYHSNKLSTHKTVLEYSFLEREDAFLKSDVGKTLLRKTAEGLLDLSFPFSLPMVRVKQKMSVGLAGSVSINISPELTKSIRNLAIDIGTTPAAIHLSVFFILLWQYIHSEDLALALPMDARIAKDQSTIGYLVNMSILRVALNPKETLINFIEKVSDQQFEALEARNIPFPLLMKEVRKLGGKPSEAWMNLVFDYLPISKRVWKLGDIDLVVDSIQTKYAKNQLKLEVEEIQDDITRCVMDFDTTLIQINIVQRMLKHYHFLIKEIINNPSLKLESLPLLTELEQQEILIDWNNTEVKYPRDKNICELFEEQVQKTPDDIAVVFGDQQITYRELNIKANQLAGYLIGIGVKPDSLVTIYMSRSIEMIITVLGVLKAGGAYVPIDIEYPIERLKYILQDTATQILLTKSILSNQLPQENIKIIYLDQNWHEIQKYSPSNLKQICYADNLAYCIFTSGSTGKPKGTLNTLRGFTNLVQWYSGEIINNINPIKMLLISSFGFDLTQKNIFGTLVNGGRIIIPQGEISDIDQLRLTVLKHNPTHINCAPSVFNAYKDILANDSVHTVILGGEVINSSLIEFFQKRRINLINSYGPTECSDVVTFYRYEANSTNIAVIPIGRPISNVQIYILDSNFMLVPVGVTGELYISGDGVGRGYLNRPDLTAEKFVPNPFGKPGSRMYRTGDLARYLLDGSIEFEGRKDHQIKIRGFRIELGEVESALQEIKAIEKAVVLVSEELDKRLVAYLVTEDGVNLNIMELRAQLQKLLPEYMIPSDWIFIHEFPLTPNGKVDRKALAGLKGSREAVSNGYIAPRTEIEKIVATIWEEVLKVERVSINDNFFALGGHSLLATQIISRVSEKFDKKIALRLLLDAPNLCVFCERLDQFFLTGEKQIIPALTRLTRRSSNF
ncbi:amino acid adenylation domain-containing protein [Acinetobacter sp. ACIN00229]|uniref:non-ribosomal peptide synthetase n=1 Tax=Acinetobacter sp. ACIN00229 TaxID=2792607 RepID=UPI0018DF670C|nr:non-ribosomal peptide synthetase [Acinetobacter sp. ACIN00229]MBI0421292.1 amino acid adenylation domain-containing protein [Acinetobacter sp. ACIN00229]